VNALEQHALEVLRMVRSIKNTFAPINRIPQEVFSLIPGYRGMGEALIALTHVCHDWREQLISHSSLWTSLDCTNVDQTRVYLERSKTSPLDISFSEEGSSTSLNDAFLLTVPHLGQLKSLSITGSSNNFIELTDHFLHCRAPLLEKLRIRFTCPHPQTIQAAIFDGDLSSLRELRLSGALTNLPWKNLSNLTTFDFRQVSSDKISVTQLLDFFEGAPILQNIKLSHAFPDTSDAPPGRIVSLLHLEVLDITAQPVHSILLDHLSIPMGASLISEFNFSDKKSPIPAYLPSTSTNLRNLSLIASINLRCSEGTSLRLEGPNGSFYMYGHWVGAATSLPAVNTLVLHSVNHFDVSVTRRLAITQYGTSPPPEIEKSLVYRTLLLMNSLRALTLTDCLNLPFIFTLNPNQSFSKTIVCPKLEEIALYISTRDRFCIDELLEMTKERASRGAKLSTITITCPQEFSPAKEVLKLRDYVSFVEYKLDDVLPAWDHIPSDVDDTGYETDW
jgi:hypothetical protein